MNTLKQVEKIKCAKLIHAARTSLGWSQSELSKRSNISKPTISRVERGENVTVETLVHLASAMGKKVSIDIK